MNKKFLAYVAIAALFTYVLITYIIQSKTIPIIDIPSLILILGSLSIFIFRNHKSNDVIKYFKTVINPLSDQSQLKLAQAFFKNVNRYLILSVFVGLGVGIFLLLTEAPVSPTDLGRGIPIMILSFIYAGIIKIILVYPFQSNIKKKLA